MTPEEFAGMQRKYQNATKQCSVILEGVAVGFILNKKKRAGFSGSRGRYISHCIESHERCKINQIELDEKDEIIDSLWKTIHRLQKVIKEDARVPPE
jgi:hypothetical protein